MVHWTLRLLCFSVQKKVLMTAVQPTGVPHLGTYLGMLEHWLQLQINEQASTPLLLAVADWHVATSGHLQPKVLRVHIRQLASGLLAAGVDPKRTTLFRQSHVPGHMELCWLLLCLSTANQLSRLTPYRDKARLYSKGTVPTGILLYPALQSADMLLYKASHVPVGDDQLHHMQFAADLARLFNRRYATEFFPIPMQAMSDLESSVTFDPIGRPAVSNLVQLFASVSKLTPSQVVDRHCHLKTGQFKVELAKVISEMIEPIRERYEYWMSDPTALDDVLEEGADKARMIAEVNMDQIRRITGYE